MAEQVPFSIVEKVITKLASVAFQEIVSIYKADDELKKLLETVATIKSVLLDAEKRQEESQAVKNWIKRLKRVLNQADDLLDDVVTQALKLRANNPSKVRKFLSSPKRIVFRREMAARIKEIKESLGDIAKVISGFNFSQAIITESKHRETGSLVVEAEIIGREQSKEEIKKLLLQSRKANENVSLVAIVGMGGLGKTTVAQLVYNDVEVAEFFGKRMWVCVSDDFDVRLIVKSILECFTKQDVGKLRLDELGTQLRDHLVGKKFLLVLDDVWNESYEKWHKLRNFLMAGAQGSKILVTSRNKEVVSIMGVEFPYQLGILTAQQSRDLFRKISFQGCDVGLRVEKEKIGDKIADKCKGVPLALTTIAGVLRSKSELCEWSSILNNEIWRLPQGDEDIMHVLKLSYDHLPVELRQCFTYCSLNEKDEVINKEELIQLWMAQGYLERSNEKQCFEDIGEDYVLNLLRRSFFQDIKKDKFGDVISFKMHDLIHDLALSIAGSDCSVYLPSKQIKEETLHLSVSGVDVCVDDFLHAKGMRTLLMESMIGDQFNSIFAFASLRSLTLSRQIRPNPCDERAILLTEIPDSIGQLTHMRYLNFSKQSELRSLPNSVCDMVNLQTLKLNGCHALKELPRDISKLVNLRCLKTENCGNLCMPAGIGKLTSLVSLPNFVVGNASNCLKLHELNGLNNLRGDLLVQNLTLVPDGITVSESSEANLKEKKCLRSLFIDWHRLRGMHSRSTSCMNDTHKRNVDLQIELLENLQPHDGLKALRISCFPGLRLATWLGSLTSLISLDLKCLKHCTYIPPLNTSPFLQKISIENAEALECIGYDIETPTMFFPSLTSLLIHGCPKLLAIECKNKTDMPLLPPPFPRLSTLNIWQAPKLIHMPPFPHLQEGLNINSCSLKPLMETLLLAFKRSSSKTAANAVSMAVEPTASSSTSLCPYAPFSKLTSLSMLEVTDCQLPKDWMQNFHSLEFLAISGSSIFVSVSTQCQHLGLLKHLIISSVHDEDVGRQWEPFGSLRSLEHLEIHSCRTLTGLPESFSELKALRELEIFQCPNFLSLPESLCRLSNSERLWISDTKHMETVLRHVGSFTSLTHLKIDRSNNLKSLPDGMRHLVNLQVLTIKYFEILEALPEWICDLTSLLQLKLSDCPRLASLPAGMRHLTSLQRLSILDCSILTGRCRKETGQDWPNIAHIPDLNIN